MLKRFTLLGTHVLPPVRTTVAKQRGSALLEALIAVVIFSVGLLGMLKVQANSIVRSSDALYRAEANAMAQEIMGIIWTDKANALGYSHFATSTNCATASGTASTNANLTQWLGDLKLPGAVATAQSIVVSATVPKVVRVRVCWRAPNTSTFSNVEIVSTLP